MASEALAVLAEDAENRPSLSEVNPLAKAWSEHCATGARTGYVAAA